MKPSVTLAVFNERFCQKKNSFCHARTKLWKCRFCPRLLFRGNTLQSRAAVQKSCRHLFVSKEPREALSYAQVTHYILTCGNRREEYLMDLFCTDFSQKRANRDQNYGTRVSFLALFHIRFRHFHHLTGRSLLDLHNTAQNPVLLSENSSNFVAKCSGAKSFAKEMGTERLMFLHPSEESTTVFVKRKEMKR